MTDEPKPIRAASFSIAVGVATAFIALAALFSLADEHANNLAGWRLRGTIAPGAPNGLPAQLPAASKRA